MGCALAMVQAHGRLPERIVNGIKVSEMRSRCASSICKFQNKWTDESKHKIQTDSRPMTMCSCNVWQQLAECELRAWASLLNNFYNLLDEWIEYCRVWNDFDAPFRSWLRGQHVRLHRMCSEFRMYAEWANERLCVCVYDGVAAIQLKQT